MVVPEQEIGPFLTRQALTLATAESCTGGLMAHRITNVPGSSAYYRGGFIVYADQAKEDLLGVRRGTLAAYGAVSEETAREMAHGARQRLGADIGLSVTGIAGPTGGTPEKPVGLVYIALVAPDVEMCRRYIWHGEGDAVEERGAHDRRLANKERSVGAALRLVLTYLQERRG